MADMDTAGPGAAHPYQRHDRSALARLCEKPAQPASSGAPGGSALEQDILSLEFSEVYLPLAQLIAIDINALQQTRSQQAALLTAAPGAAPFIIGLGGSVASGKSTAAALLQRALKTLPGHADVALVPSDGFLHPNAVLIERGLLDRKGFPESFDHAGLIGFLQRLKSGASPVEAPLYSHVLYDVLPDQTLLLDKPGIVIVEGVNVLQMPAAGGAADGQNPHLAASDYLDYSIYLHAEEALIKQWFTARFLELTGKAANDPAQFYHRFAPLSHEQRLGVADFVWSSINGKNLNENILPGMRRAGLILHKAADHRISHIELRNR